MSDNSQPMVESALQTLHLDLLQAGSGEESKRLLEVCRTHGFFYLDLTSDPMLCSYWEEVLVVMKKYFEQPLETKMRDACGSDNRGYEPSGTEVGPHPDTRDGYESLKISRREFLNGEIELSTSIRECSELLFNFMKKAHHITMMMLGRLSDEMELEGSARFEAFHADAKPTFTNLAVLMYAKHDDSTQEKLGHNKHTDIGSLTFLLAQQWGLQILSPSTGMWEFVKPLSKHAVINVGDSLHFPSGRELVSVVHRVIPPHRKLDEDRYSIAYFLRVNDDLRWKDSTGKCWSAKEWHNFKFDAFRSPGTMENGMQVLTGEMEENNALISRIDRQRSVAGVSNV